jgi:dTMP kinase
MNPCFITLEGIEGVGKTSHLDRVCDLLRERGLSVVRTREPGGTLAGEAIREVLLHGPAMHRDTELLLMFAARAEHLQQLIRPALGRGEWVVCDRFVDATHAYQGGGRGIAEARIDALTEWVLGKFRPHLTLLLDAPVEIALARARNRGPADRFESERLEFFARVRAAYLHLAEAEPGRFRVIDAAADLDSVGRAVERAVVEFLERAA